MQAQHAAALQAGQEAAQIAGEQAAQQVTQQANMQAAQHQQTMHERGISSVGMAMMPMGMPGIPVMPATMCVPGISGMRMPGNQGLGMPMGMPRSMGMMQGNPYQQMMMGR